MGWLNATNDVPLSESKDMPQEKNDAENIVRPCIINPLPFISIFLIINSVDPEKPNLLEY
jgi:hypothetical protein